MKNSIGASNANDFSRGTCFDCLFFAHILPLSPPTNMLSTTSACGSANGKHTQLLTQDVDKKSQQDHLVGLISSQQGV
jgi:hypothetical protein